MRLSQNTSLKCSFAQNVWHLKLIISCHLSLSVDLTDFIEDTGFRGQKRAQEGKVVENEESWCNWGLRMLISDQEQEGWIKKEKDAWLTKRQGKNDSESSKDDKDRRGQRARPQRVRREHFYSNNCDLLSAQITSKYHWWKIKAPSSQHIKFVCLCYFFQENGHIWRDGNLSSIPINNYESSTHIKFLKHDYKPASWEKKGHFWSWQILSWL